ncbi:MAG: tetratricopeptide repeat protein [bacterium]|nr:tetratricopeptide repeat protein [bacterium]
MRRHALVYLAFASLALLVYSPALGGGFLWDDTDWIRDNAALQSWNGLWRIWFEPGAVIQYYPLTYTSWWLDARCFDLDPAVMHVENVLLHALNATLLTALLRRLELPLAIGAGAIFLLHPVHVESVAWLVERKNTLSTAFYLGSALGWLSWLEHGGARRLALAATTFLLALLAKTATLMLPVSLLALAIWRRETPARALRGLAPFATLTVLAASSTIVMERGEGAIGYDWSLTLGERCALLGQNCAFYAGKLAWPQPLAFVYAKWDLGTGTVLGWLPTCVTIAALAAAVWCVRSRTHSRRTLGVSLTFLTFFAGLLPVSGLVDFYYLRYAFAADHFQYLPSLGPIALVCCGSATLLGPARRRFAIASLTLLGSVLAFLTFERTPIYRDLETLWRATIATEPDAWLAHTNLGNLLATPTEPDAGIEHHERAIKIYDHAFESNNALGNHHVRHGRFAEARACFDRAVQARPDDALTFNNLGTMAGIQGDFRSARDWLERGHALAPGNRDLMRNLTLLLSQCPDPTIRDGPRALQLAEQLNNVDDPDLLDRFALFRALLITDQRPRAIELGQSLLERARTNGNADIAGRVERQLQRLRR